MATGLDHVKRIRRVDLFRDDDVETAEAEGQTGAADDEAAAAARAALDAYMAQTLGLDLSLPRAPAPAPKKVKVAPAPAVDKKTKAAKKTHDDTKMEEDHDSTSDDDDETPARRTAAVALKETAFTFRLFAAPRAAVAKPPVAGSTASTATVTGDMPALPLQQAAPQPPATVIVLPDDIDADDDAAAGGLGVGGLLNPPRPLSHYVAGPPTPAELARYAATAVRGEDVAALARPDCRNAWGWERPWRARTVVRHLSRDALLALLANAVPDTETTVTAKRDLARALHAAANRLPAWAAGTGSETTASESDSPRRRCRPGKNRRKILHRRAQAVREKEAAATAARLSKEEHLLEKKKRLNRTKKLRRRAKKRATTSDAGGDADGDDSQSSRAASEEA